MTNTANGFLMGDPVGGRWSLFKTTNGGFQWDSTGIRLSALAGEWGWVNGMFVLNNQIWFSTNGLRIYYSSNNGLNWAIQNGPDQGSYGSVWFNNSQTGMCIGITQTGYSTNSGISWILRNSPVIGLSGIMGYGNSFWVSVFNSPSQIYITSNGGLTWQSEHNSNENVRHITASRTGNIGWACLANGMVLKRSTPLNININSAETPEKFILRQNYPNPFNPLTNIEFSIAEYSAVKLIVYDALGREVEILLNEKLNPGTYTAHWDASIYPSGVYFYQLTGKGINDIKKMVLVK
jgi:hypothetical protein